MEFQILECGKVFRSWHGKEKNVNGISILYLNFRNGMYMLNCGHFQQKLSNINLLREYYFIFTRRNGIKHVGSYGIFLNLKFDLIFSLYFFIDYSGFPCPGHIRFERNWNIIRFRIKVG